MTGSRFETADSKILDRCGFHFRRVIQEKFVALYNVATIQVMQSPMGSGLFFAVDKVNSET